MSESKTSKKPKFVFFGTPQIAVTVLEELKALGLLPSLIVTNPDTPQGRKMVLTPPPTKQWAEQESIPVLQPDSLKHTSLAETLEAIAADVFVVVAYGKIIPKTILDIPSHGVVNMHPSLLPKLRGASPIRSAILHDMQHEIGVTIMLLDTKMDHGPILSQKKMPIEDNHWPMRGEKLDSALAHLGGALLANTIPRFMDGEITPIEQDHGLATFCDRIEKKDGELEIDPYNLPTGSEAYQTLLKIRAYDGWPGTYFFYEKNGRKMRIKIVDACISDDTLQITRIIPEGKKEMHFTEYFGS